MEEKNTPARYHCSFEKLRTLANGAPDWCGIGKESDACQLTVSLYCFSISVRLLELERLGMSRVLCNEEVKAITLVIRTRFARSTKTYTTFTSCQNAACSNTFFFLESRLCSRGFYALTKHM